MKKFFYIIVASIIFFYYGCSSVKVAKPYCLLYGTSSEAYCASYVILKFPSNPIMANNHEFLYHLSCGSNIIGTWRTDMDTLFLKPYMDYQFDSGRLDFSQHNDSDLNIASMPRTFLIKNKGRKLIEITDYSILYGAFSKDPDIYYTEFNLMSEW